MLELECGVKLNIGYSEIQENFQLCIHIPVSNDKFNKKNKLWLGPIVDFTLSEMEMFTEFLKIE